MKSKKQLDTVMREKLNELYPNFRHCGPITFNNFESFYIITEESDVIVILPQAIVDENPNLPTKIIDYLKAEGFADDPFLIDKTPSLYFADSK
jgi:hypothetical protein